MKVTIEVFGTESANELLCASRFLGDLASTKNEVIEQPEKVSDEKAAKLKAEEDAAVAARIAEAERKRAALEQAEAEAKAKAWEEEAKKAKADAEKKTKAAAKAKADEEAAAKALEEAAAQREAAAEAQAQAKAQAEAEAASTDFDIEPEQDTKPLTVEDCRKVAMIALNKQKKSIVEDAFKACDAKAFPSLKAENYKKFVDYIKERL